LPVSVPQNPTIALDRPAKLQGLSRDGRGWRSWTQRHCPSRRGIAVDSIVEAVDSIVEDAIATGDKNQIGIVFGDSVGGAARSLRQDGVDGREATLKRLRQSGAPTFPFATTRFGIDNQQDRLPFPHEPSSTEVIRARIRSTGRMGQSHPNRFCRSKGRRGRDRVFLPAIHHLFGRSG